MRTTSLASEPPDVRQLSTLLGTRATGTSSVFRVLLHAEAGGENGMR